MKPENLGETPLGQPILTSGLPAWLDYALLIGGALALVSAVGISLAALISFFMGHL